MVHKQIAVGAHDASADNRQHMKIGSGIENSKLLLTDYCARVGEVYAGGFEIGI